MFEAIGTVLGAASVGGPLGMIVGLAKLAIQGWQVKTQASAELEVLRERNAHELALRDKDKELMQAEAAGQFKVAQAEGESAIETARMNAIAASFAADRATFATGDKAKDSALFIFVDAVRGLIRPGITLFFDLAVLIIFAVLMWLLWDQLALMFSQNDERVTTPMMNMLIDIVKTIIFLATTATGYWFVARPDHGRGGTTA